MYPLLTGDGVLASIVFTAVGVGTTSLDLTNVKLLDANAEKIPVSEEDGAITVEQILYGDVSDDGSVSAYDASLVLQHVVGLINLSPEQQEVADVTGDDTISALDAALILQYTVGLITSFPVDNPPVAPALNPPNETKLLTGAIEQLETISLTTNLGVRADYSQYGADIDFVAPSSGGTVAIFTTDVSQDSRGLNIGQDNAGDLQGLYTNNFGGTSAATPIAASIAALMLSVNPDLTCEQVRQIMRDTAEKIDRQNGQYDENGFSQFYGYGRVNSYRAVREALIQRQLRQWTGTIVS